MDTFTFTVYTEPNGYVWTDTVTLRINLMLYPTAKGATLPFKV